MPVVEGSDPVVAIALHLAELARLAYGSELSVRQELDSQYQHIGFLDNGWGFVASNPQVIAIVFTGTKDVFDVLVDLSVDLVSGFGGSVHQGFAVLSEALWEDVTDGVRQMRDNDQGILITGHSLGGAMAILAGQKFCEANLPPAHLHTFGAPKVGDLSFSKNYQASVIRFENSGDSVPSLPPFEEYHHVGTQCILTILDQLYVPDGSLADKLVSGIELVGQGWQIFQRIRDGHKVSRVLWEEMATKYHNIDRYVAKLATCRQAAEA